MSEFRVDYKPTKNTYDLWGDIEALVLHTTLGTYLGAVSWLQNLKGQNPNSSAHAVFGRTGKIAQLANFDKGTWHAGGIYKPSARALAVLSKTLWGTLKNPNRRTLGLEFASGYDIDRDGILEGWERLYTPVQIKAAVWYTLNRIEPATKKTFTSKNILTHYDINRSRPNLELQRAMFIAELSKQRAIMSTEPQKIAEVAPEDPVPQETIKEVHIKGSIDKVEVIKK